MALPGISNANEFYSAHYLDSVLTGDIKKVRERWAEEAKAQVQADPTADISTPEALFKTLRKPLAETAGSGAGHHGGSRRAPAAAAGAVLPAAVRGPGVPLHPARRARADRR